MNSILRYILLIGLLSLGAAASLQGNAYAASNCSVAPISDLVKDYNPFTAPGTLTVAAGTINVTCDRPKGAVIKVFVSGSSAGYTTPTLSEPGGFTLSYTMCPPGASPCNGATNVWNTTNGYTLPAQTSNGLGIVIPVPSFLIFTAQQDAPYGTTAQYQGSLFFSVTCDGVAC